MTTALKTIVSSSAKSLEISRAAPTVIIGERINPTGRKKVLAALQEGNFDQIRQDAQEQVAAGARMLDVNAGVPGALVNIHGD
jgi:5-methyltetrahydrofolate--homocysteine methyltransferase